MWRTELQNGSARLTAGWCLTVIQASVFAFSLLKQGCGSVCSAPCACINTCLKLEPWVLVSLMLRVVCILEQVTLLFWISMFLSQGWREWLSSWPKWFGLCHNQPNKVIERTAGGWYRLEIFWRFPLGLEYREEGLSWNVLILWNIICIIWNWDL